VTKHQTFSPRCWEAFFFQSALFKKNPAWQPVSFRKQVTLPTGLCRWPAVECATSRCSARCRRGCLPQPETGGSIARRRWHRSFLSIEPPRKRPERRLVWSESIAPRCEPAQQRPISRPVVCTLTRQSCWSRPPSTCSAQRTRRSRASSTEAKSIRVRLAYPSVYRRPIRFELLERRAVQQVLALGSGLGRR
jgi:hypothetical protein